MFLPQSEGSSKSIPEKLSATLRRLHLLPFLGTMHDIMTLHQHSYLQECIDSMDFQWRQGSLTFHVYISFYLRTTCVFWCFGVLGKCYLIRVSGRHSQLQFLRKSLACHGSQLGVLSTLPMTGQVNAQKMPTIVLLFHFTSVFLYE